jgi:hypothetical protein
MLLVHLLLAPPKGIKQFESSHLAYACLQVVKYALDAKRDRFEIIDVSGHLVDCSAESPNDKEGLQE